MEIVGESNRTLEYLTSVERLAQEILADRETLVFLDRRRNESREAVRDLKRSDDRDGWLAVGSVFFGCPSQDAVVLIEADRADVDAQIEEIGKGLRAKVDRLRDLEKSPPTRGGNLVPLSDRERRVLFTDR